MSSINGNQNKGFEKSHNLGASENKHYLKASTFGSKHALGFGSMRSLGSNAEHKLATAQPTLQSSWLNVAAPIPVGASYLGLHEHEEHRFRSQEELELEKSAPADRLKLVYLIFMIHGAGTLLPWNMFLTADKYFTDFKLAAGVNQTESEYAKNFLSYLGITAQLPNLILNAINIFCQCQSGKTSVRIGTSIAVLILMFIVTIILAIADSSEWQGSFFGITMVTIVIINMASGLYQNSLYGLAGPFPMRYTNAIILGNNISGILTSVIMIITLLASPNIQLAAIWYFIAAVIVLCVALDSYFVLPFLRFFKHHTKDRHGAQNEKSSEELMQVETPPEGPVAERPPYMQIFKQIWPQLIGVWLVFFVSLLCFPVMQADIRPSNPDLLIPENLYTPITTFLFFNLFAALGNLTTEWIRKPGPKYVIIPIVLRLLFIPFFMFCNFRPDVRKLPVYINNDYGYFAGGILMAYTSGYFSSLCMMYSPSLVEPRWAGTAAMISAFFLILGIVCGVNFTLVISKIVEM